MAEAVSMCSSALYRSDVFVQRYTLISISYMHNGNWFSLVTFELAWAF